MSASSLRVESHHDVFDLSREELDDLPFGVITLDRQGKVIRYNRFEEKLAGRTAQTTLGLYFFTDIAPCTNVQAFRGRFDLFSRGSDAGVERFDFSFNFRWGRQDVSVTMLRKAAHADINIIVRGHLMDRAAGAAGSEDGTHVQWSQKLRNDAAAKEVYASKGDAPQSAFRLGGADEDALRPYIHIDDRAMVAALLAEATRERQPYTIEYRSIRLDRSIALIQESGCFLDVDAPGCATIRDITDRRQVQEENSYAASHDRLTGLTNAAVLLGRITDAVSEAEANGEIAAVLVTNINKFAGINDTFGYEIGNKLLQMLALRLGECVRGGDTVARLGLDRFAVLLTGIDAGLSIAEAAVRLVAAVSEPFLIDERQYFLTISIGISLAPYDSHDPNFLLQAADIAMRAAKAAGPNRFFWYHADMTVDREKNARCTEDLRAALSNEELELFYQPLVDKKLDRVVAVESLVRWNHPTRGLVGPDEFITLADRTGLIVPLGEWVLREACRQACEWRDMGLELRVCVNVSAVQFCLPNFVTLVASILAESGLPSGWLELELTESVMVDGFGDMIEKLGQLKALGLRLSIDDFGTGYSSLAYLKYFPVDTLKIDRAFVTDITTDRFDRAIAASVFALANELGLDCVVEGVETVDQLNTLSAIGCHVMQGYYFSKPMKAAALTELLGRPVGAMRVAEEPLQSMFIPIDS